MNTFLQTEQWQKFQESLGRRTFFINGAFGLALLIRHELPFGKNYLYCPRGPITASNAETTQTSQTSQITNNSWSDILKEFLEKAFAIAKKERSIFLRWDVPFLKNEFHIGQWSMVNGQKFATHPTRGIQPQHTIVLDLTKTEEELLRSMHEKTRYNIRLAERKKVLVRQANSEQGLEIFWKLLCDTAERDRFSLHAKDHYQKLLETFKEELSASKNSRFLRLYVAEHGSIPLATALVMFSDGIATYLHGASSNMNRELMTPHLLHWKIIQDARSSGCTAYDLYGIDDDNPAWAGITRFKRGFGGTETAYSDPVDVVFDRAWHLLYRIAKNFSK